MRPQLCLREKLWTLDTQKSYGYYGYREAIDTPGSFFFLMKLALSETLKLSTNPESCHREAMDT